jgi:hypothetical protein
MREVGEARWFKHAEGVRMGKEDGTVFFGASSLDTLLFSCVFFIQVGKRDWVNWDLRKTVCEFISCALLLHSTWVLFTYSTLPFTAASSNKAPFSINLSLVRPQ